MGARDRLIVCVAVAFIAVGAMWVLVVGPKRSQANAFGAQISSARASLTSAEGQLSSARESERSYRAEVRALSRLSSALPANDGVPQLLRQISALAGGHSVDFQEISLSSGSPTTAGFNTLQLTFSFKGGYVQLQNFLDALDKLTRSDGTNVLARGRLVTVDSVSLSPLAPNSTTASVMATIYQTPSPAGVTGASGAVTTTSTPTQTTAP
jgi:Tfp pilus assembly protein PilO